eukprot:TRINITY_DN14421_c0_g2_i4.p1 TRINITY_DN14421_c0_g2~~TRINITY_DN14421_c0_g2_i4.p1  ORF type:complete len:528 (+),score=129.89 TRINITY_DN14421_c0_g2_i4:41-1624(+)
MRLTLRDVSVRYKGATALHGVDIDVGTGLVGIIGDMGSGKTTLLQVLGRMRKADGGEVVVSPEPASPRAFGYVGSGDPVFDPLTVGKLVKTRAKLLNTPIEEAHSTLATLGLGDCTSTNAMALSGGQKRRLAICLELQTDPELLVIDEATTGLDSFTAESLVATLRQQAEHKLIVISLHQPSPAILNQLHYIIVLEEGKAVYQGPPSSMLDFLRLNGTEPKPQMALSEQVLDMCSSLKADIHSLTIPWATGHGEALVHTTPDSLGWFRLLCILFERSLASNFGGAVFKMRLVRAAFFALCIGGLFYQVGVGSEVELQSQRGLLFLLLAESQQEPLLDMIRKTPITIGATKHEVLKGLYPSSVSMVANFLTDLLVQCVVSLVFLTPIYLLSGMVEYGLAYFVLLTLTTCARCVGMLISLLTPAYFALTVGSLVNFLSVISSGYLVAPSSMPGPVSWLSDVLYFPQAYRVLTVTQFQDRNLNQSISGSEYLETLYPTATYSTVFGMFSVWMAVLWASSSVLFCRTLFER